MISIKNWILAFAVLSVAGLFVDAAPRRLSNLGETNSLTEKKFNPGNNTNPRSDLMMQNDRIQFQEWHRSYSSIGEKRVDQFAQRGGKEFRTDTVEYGTWERKEARISLEADQRKLANVKNWNTVRENVLSHQFSGTEMQTPEAKRFSEMVDEVSLRDINRYQFMKNKTDAGIPVQRAGSNEGPSLSQEQQRVKARIDGGKTTEVQTYEEQGAKSIGEIAAQNNGNEPGFFESLFDW